VLKGDMVAQEKSEGHWPLLIIGQWPLARITGTLSAVSPRRGWGSPGKT